MYEFTKLACCFISEGLAVGVGFGAIGKSPSATFESAR
jgi:zinc transporter 11